MVLTIISQTATNTLYDFRQATLLVKKQVFDTVFRRMRQMIENYYSVNSLRETVSAALDMIYQDHRDEIIFQMNNIICEKHLTLLIIQYL